MKQAVLVLGGALLGGVIGHFGVLWMARQGFYAMVLPGGLIGLGAGMTCHSSRALPIVCGLLALVNGLFTEWCNFPFVKDDSLGYFMTHLTDLRTVTVSMIVAGTVIGFWVPFRRTERSKKPAA